MKMIQQSVFHSISEIKPVSEVHLLNSREQALFYCHHGQSYEIRDEGKICKTVSKGA